ncbi:hypothetical protein OOK27_08650 [Streptomyces canus]|nr:hypothetical protein [Streptomyces canus]MCX5254245.1 hypothetical protein [Streptomyces canus]
MPHSNHPRHALDRPDDIALLLATRRTARRPERTEEGLWLFCHTV